MVKKPQATQPTQPEVVVQELVKQATPITDPTFGEVIPSSGMAKSVVETGRDPTNDIPNPLPPPADLTSKEAAGTESQEATADQGASGTVTQAGGE